MMGVTAAGDAALERRNSLSLRSGQLHWSATDVVPVRRGGCHN